MKRVLQGLATSLVTIGLMGGVAAATTTCNGTITNTGPGSTNTITCDDTQNQNVSCDNNLIVDNSNHQSANSGQAFTTGNTSGGNATTGNSENSNTTSVDVHIGDACALVATAVTPPAGGSGGVTLGASTTAAAKAAQVVAPVGGVGAGAGGGVATNSVIPITGLIASAGVAGIGLALRKRFLATN